MITQEKGDGKGFISHAPGYWPDIRPELWNDWKWQLKNRVTSLAQLEKHLQLSDEERSGVLLSGDKLALAVTPHFFNLVPYGNPEDPIRRQMIPRIEETWGSPYDMADPCGEDSHMPVPGLVHRYPDRVLFLVTDRCASYCRYCTRSRVVSGVGEQELHTNFEEAFRYLEAHTEVRDVLLSGGDALIFLTKGSTNCFRDCDRFRILNSCGSARVFRFSCRSVSRLSCARCWRNIIRFG